ncbi:MAG: hypothetical protein ACRDMV_01130 [Streptosporangiales bacterium]
MSWVRIDDSFYDHPKFAMLNALGITAWLTGLAYCNRNLTNGFVPAGAARRLFDCEGLGVYTGTFTGEDAEPIHGVEQLVEVGLWHEVNGGYQVHDYLEYQPSREQVLAEREKTAERVRRHRGRQGADQR